MPAGATNAPTFVTELHEGGQKEHISQYMSSNGDGTGTVSVNGNYSGGSALTISVTPPAGEIYRITHVVLGIMDTNGMTLGTYGTIAGGVNPGPVLRKQDDTGTLVDYTKTYPPTTNFWIASMVGPRNFEHIDVGGTADEAIYATFDFIGMTGQAVRLVGDDSERLEVYLNDDFSGLLNHTWYAWGYKEVG